VWISSRAIRLRSPPPSPSTPPSRYPEDGPIRSYALTGLKHSGKTTLGRRLARELALPFSDLDEEIVRRAASEGILSDDAGDEPPIRRVYRSLGKTDFGRWEVECLHGISQPVVLATGGGVCDHVPTMELLQERFRILYLHDDPLVLYQRIVRGGIPAFLDPARPREHFLEIAERRGEIYRQTADVIVDLSGASRGEAFTRLLLALR
jgi:shikimate kinase